MDFNKKANREFFNEKLLFKTVGIIFLIIILVLILSDFKIYQKKKELAVQISTYKKQIEEIKKNNQNLKNEIVNADNTDYLEKLGYEQFGETKPGETEYIFVQSQKKAEATLKAENFWSAKYWADWFYGIGQWIKNNI
jgi:cell division protein FtsB